MHKQRYSKPPKNFLEDAKKKYFADCYDDLLNIEGSVDIDKLIDKIRRFVRDHADGVTSSQLRNIFGKIKTVKNIRELKMLRPKIAYIIARQNNDKAKTMIHVFDDLMAKTDATKLKGFQSFMESVVAYHKYFEKA